MQTPAAEGDSPYGKRGHSSSKSRWTGGKNCVTRKFGENLVESQWKKNMKFSLAIGRLASRQIQIQPTKWRCFLSIAGETNSGVEFDLAGGTPPPPPPLHTTVSSCVVATPPALHFHKQPRSIDALPELQSTHSTERAERRRRGIRILLQLCTGTCTYLSLLAS